MAIRRRYINYRGKKINLKVCILMPKQGSSSYHYEPVEIESGTWSKAGQDHEFSIPRNTPVSTFLLSLVRLNRMSGPEIHGDIRVVSGLVKRLVAETSKEGPQPKWRQRHKERKEKRVAKWPRTTQKKKTTKHTAKA